MPRYNNISIYVSPKQESIHEEVKRLADEHLESFSTILWMLVEAGLMAKNVKFQPKKVEIFEVGKAENGAESG